MLKRLKYYSKYVPILVYETKAKATHTNSHTVSTQLDIKIIIMYAPQI